MYKHLLSLSTFAIGGILIILPFGAVDGVNVNQRFFAPFTISESQCQKTIETLKLKNIISTIEDSVKSKRDTVISESKEIEIERRFLNFSRTLLDSFLITNPGYSKLILKERVKNLKDTVSMRQQWEKRINDAIHKYLRENYPEGSEHAINKYTGPGINIPIDDLTDKIKGIF